MSYREALRAERSSRQDHCMADMGEFEKVMSAPFTLAQARSAGLTDGQIRALRRRSWVTLRRGIYLPRDLMDRARTDPHALHVIRVRAALLSLGAGAAASHESALVLAGIDVLGVPTSVQVTKPRNGWGTKTGSGDLVVHYANLPPEQLCSIGGVPATTPARAVVDVARTRSFQDGVVVADAALRHKLVHGKALREVLASCVRWPGCRNATRVVEFADPAAESALESVSRVMFHQQGLPAPRTQVWIGQDGPRDRVDFLWDTYRTVGEADGLSKYANRTDALRTEKLRQERLERAGYTVVRFTWDDVTAHAEHTAARIRWAFARAGVASAARDARVADDRNVLGYQ